MNLILTHFNKVDPTLAKLADRWPFEEIKPYKPEDYYLRLCRSIVGQQLSVKAAASIWGKFESNIKIIEPEIILEKDTEELRSLGLSYSKIKYLKALSKSTLENKINFLEFENLDNQKIVDQLVSVKGIGQWTAEMFLMFTMGRTDVFSTGDLGLKRAIEKHYLLDNPDKIKLEAISQPWSPYRTYACLILWHSLDNQPK